MCFLLYASCFPHWMPSISNQREDPSLGAAFILADEHCLQGKQGALASGYITADGDLLCCIFQPFHFEQLLCIASCMVCMISEQDWHVFMWAAITVYILKSQHRAWIQRGQVSCLAVHLLSVTSESSAIVCTPHSNCTCVECGMSTEPARRGSGGTWSPFSHWEVRTVVLISDKFLQWKRPPSYISDIHFPDLLLSFQPMPV